MLARVISGYQQWTKRKKIIAELSSMSDRDLADIGIKRWDIERIVREELAKD